MLKFSQCLGKKYSLATPLVVQLWYLLLHIHLPDLFWTGLLILDCMESMDSELDSVLIGSRA